MVCPILANPILANPFLDFVCAGAVKCARLEFSGCRVKPAAKITATRRSESASEDSSARGNSWHA